MTGADATGNADDAPPAPGTDGPAPWPRLSSERGPSLFICRVRFDRLENPRTREAMRRTVLEFPDWVNVVALTPERRLVVVRQYRFGTEDVTTEVPGGVIDRGEHHGDAARRELREETGYASERWTYLGSVEPNPAIQDNRCHHWLAEDAVLAHPQELDGGEDIVVDTVDGEQLRELVRSGGMRHALALTALAELFDLTGLRRGDPAEAPR